MYFGGSSYIVKPFESVETIPRDLTRSTIKRSSSTRTQLALWRELSKLLSGSRRSGTLNDESPYEGKVAPDNFQIVRTNVASNLKVRLRRVDRVREKFSFRHLDTFRCKCRKRRRPKLIHRVCRRLVRENSPKASRMIDKEWLVRGLARLIAVIVTRQRSAWEFSVSFGNVHLLPDPLYSLDSRLDGPCWSTQAEQRDGGERSRKLRSSKFDGRVVTLDAFNISEYPVPGFHGTPRHAMPRYAVPPPRQTYIRDLWSRLPWPLLDQINSLRSIF